MKKRIGILILIAVLTVSAFALVGCGGISGIEVTKEGYNLAMSNYEKKMSDGNFRMDVTMKMSTPIDGKVEKKTGTFILAIQNKTKAYMKMSADGQTEEMYLEQTGGKTYLIMKIDNSWVGQASSISLSSIFQEDTSGALGALDTAVFDDLEYRGGRYYFNEKLLNQAAGAGASFEECYIAFKDDLVLGMGMKFSATVSEMTIDYDTEVKFSYSPNINIPSYSK